MSRFAKSREKRENDQNATAVTNNRNLDQCLLFLKFLYLGSIPEIANYRFLLLWGEGPKASLRPVKDKNEIGKNDDNNDADDQEGNIDAAADDDAYNDNDKVYDADDADDADDSDEDKDEADDDDVVG